MSPGPTVSRTLPSTPPFVFLDRARLADSIAAVTGGKNRPSERVTVGALLCPQDYIL